MQIFTALLESRTVRVRPRPESERGGLGVRYAGGGMNENRWLTHRRFPAAHPASMRSSGRSARGN